MAGNKATLEGAVDFRDSFQEMMNSITTPYDECIKTLIANIKLDPHFKSFFDWSLQNNIPVVVISGGMVPIIEALLEHLLGPDYSKIQIVANDVAVKPGHASINEVDGWDIVYHDDSGHGHDKSLTLKPYAALPEGERPTMFYAGDGVSDLSAAKETDLLFAKKGMDLITYCVREKIPFTEFEDWSSITQTVMDIVAGKTDVHAAAKAGHDAYMQNKATHEL